MSKTETQSSGAGRAGFVKFTREKRYLVFKKTDVCSSLTDAQFETLYRLLGIVAAHRERVHKAPLECVVIESDWPEYEPAWKAIEDRMKRLQPLTGGGEFGIGCVQHDCPECRARIASGK